MRLGLSLYLLFMLGVIGVVSSAIIRYYGFLPENWTLPKLSFSEYSWQRDCDSQCAEEVGKADMKVIDEAGCVDLSMYTPLDVAHVKALNDKIDYIPCDGVERKNLGAYDISTPPFHLPNP